MNLLNFVAMSQSPEGQGGGFAGMIPFILIIFVVYFLMIRPQSKKAKHHKNMLAELKKGDKIVTIGGIFGSIIQVKDKSFSVKIANNTEIEILKSSVAEVINDTKEIENKQA
ncbi:MAG: preprotein translocase subunit YajC [Candidatus Delongbacteria bacterium]|nr:preprotein translocase subunit YajC [Candidatus Delongbacteria bacterium]